MNEIRYDHENIRSIAAALRDRAHDLRRDAEVGAAEALEAIKAEASRYTRSGAPAPIYAEVIDQADEALTIIVKKSRLLAAAMEEHAAVLEGGSAGALEIEENAVRALTSVDPDAPAPSNTAKPAALTAEERALMPDAPAPTSTPVNVQKPAPAHPPPPFRPLYGP